jgi:hypothetical protein
VSGAKNALVRFSEFYTREAVLPMRGKDTLACGLRTLCEKAVNAIECKKRKESAKPDVCPQRARAVDDIVRPKACGLRDAAWRRTEWLSIFT